MTDKGITLHRAALCPHCGYTVTATGTLDGEEGTPGPGDWVLCMACAGVLQVDQQGLPALPPLGTYEALALQDPPFHAELERGRARIRQMHAAVGPPPSARRGREGGRA